MCGFSKRKMCAWGEKKDCGFFWFECKRGCVERCLRYSERWGGEGGGLMVESVERHGYPSHASDIRITITYALFAGAS